MNAPTPPEYLTAEDDTSRLRVPPHSVEAEQSVLGGLLLDNAAWDRAGELLVEGDFYRHENRLIFAAIAGLVQHSQPADVVTVYERLQRDGKAGDVGGLAHLNALAQCVPSAANMRRYAEIVRERSVLRQVIAECDAAATAAFGGTGALAVVESLAGKLSAIERGSMHKAPRSIGALAALAMDRYNDMAEGRASPAWATGIDPLDAILSGGLRPGKVYGLAARPSVGKSSAARAIALHLADAGHPTLLLSQEMPVDEVTDCALAQLGGIRSDRLQTGNMEAADWAGLATAGDRVAQMPLFIDDDGGLTVQQIGAKARSIRGLRVLVLDYLQLSTSTLKNATTNDQVAEISKGLKQLALRMGIAVVVLSQLSRKVEERADKEPQLSDLRDSGAIEQDIDVAVLLWTIREPEYAARLVGWKVAKQRGGRKGRFAMNFDAARYAWTESDEQISSGRASARGTQGGFE